MRRTLRLALVGATTLITTAAFAQVVTVPNANFGGPIGDAANTIIPNAATVGASYTLGGSVLVTSGTVTPVIATTWGVETEIQMENSAFPGQFVNFTLSSLTAAYPSIVLGPNTTRFFTSNAIGAAVIPSTSTWTLEFWDSFDDGAPGSVDASVANLSFTLQGPLVPAYQAGNAGPVPSIVSFLDNAINPTWSGPAVAANFTLGSIALASADYTAIVAADWPNDTAIIFRNSAYPVSYAFIRPFSATGAFPALSVSDAAVFVNGPLLYSSISAGSTFNFQLFNTVDDSSVGTTEANIGNIAVKLTNEAAPTAPSATDLGTVSNGSDIVQSITVPASGVNWYKFTVPQDITFTGGKWLDIFTDSPTAQDTEIGLYTSNGAFVATDDDDAAGAFGYSALSFGAGINPAIGDGVPFDGRDGDIAAGTYYLAVCEWDGLFGQSFAVSTSGTGVALFEAVNLTIRTNAISAPANVDVTGTVNLNDTVSPLAQTRFVSVKIMQGATTLFSGMAAPSTPNQAFSFPVPASATGPATIEFDGSPYLKRVVNINLTGSNVAVGTVNVQNGDVDNSGEVDAADIDQVIADFGSSANIPSDVDASGEVDAADIDIVIANFGGTDD